MNYLSIAHIDEVKMEMDDLLIPIAKISLSIRPEDIQNMIMMHGPDFMPELQRMIGEIVLDSYKTQD